MFRVSRAKDMLKYTPLSIKEISYEIGIQNPFYFCRLFKKIEGMTPSEFRKKEQMLISTV
jgi:YesN/AraC family two-component response regulator